MVGVAALRGDRDVESEDLMAYELGYRFNASEFWSFDTAIFFHDYDDLISQEEHEPEIGALFGASDSVVLLPLEFANALKGESFGGEIAIELRPANWWRLLASYSYIKINVSLGNSGDLRNKNLMEGATPQNQFSLQSSTELCSELRLDALLRYVDRLPEGDIDSYMELDLQFAWKPSQNVELSVTGHNLLESKHREFVGNLFGPPPIELERGVFAKVSLNY